MGRNWRRRSSASARSEAGDAVGGTYKEHGLDVISCHERLIAAHGIPLDSIHTRLVSPKIDFMPVQCLIRSKTFFAAVDCSGVA
jgi:hypothetical protein